MIAATDLPDGAIVTVPGSATTWLHWHGAFRRWSFAGYGPAEKAPGGELLSLTCAPMRAVLTHGYAPELRGISG